MSAVLCCTNERCRFFGVERIIARTEVCEGVYLLPAYECECGYALMRMPRITTV